MLTAYSSSTTAAEESPDGSHGSVFVVRLPLGSDHLPVEAVDETIAPEPIGTSRFTNSILEEASTWIGDEQGQVAGLAGGVGSGVSNKSQSTHGNESAPTITDVSDASTTLFWAKSDTVMVRFCRFCLSCRRCIADVSASFRLRRSSMT